MDMNERLWLTSTDPLALLAELFPQTTLGSEQPQTRRSRMYLLACARRSWERLPVVCRALVALAEVCTDSSNKEEWLWAQVAPIAEQLMHSEGEPSDLLAAHTGLLLAQHIAGDVELALRDASIPPYATPNPPLTSEEWRGLVQLVYLPFVRNTPTYGWVPQSLHSARLLREVCGNPYRFIPFEVAWRTSDAVAIARHMYDSREFSAMPILADALQEAGCNSAAVLDHCRKQGKHVRGCWVVDRVLNLK